jgi:hypothetical protein
VPKGKEHRYTTKEDNIARGISEEYQKKGYSKKEADRIGYSTLNKIKRR